MNLFDILRLAAERAAETGDEMRPEFHNAMTEITIRLSEAYTGTKQAATSGKLLELCHAASKRRDSIIAAEEAQGKFAAIIAEATGGTAQ